MHLELSNRAKKFLNNCDLNLRKRILEKVKLLSNEAIPHNAKRIKGEERAFRIRIGDYRVLYEVNWNSQYILIVKIDKRSRVYN